MRAIGYFCTAETPDVPLQVLERALVHYCKDQGHQPVATFSDTAPLSDKTPSQYARMLEYMRNSGSEYLVLIPDARHLGADLEEVARRMVQLEAAGARVVCTDEELPDPLQNALNLLGTRGISRIRSQGIKAAMQAKAVRGEGLGKPPYGYRIGHDGKLEIVLEEANTVKLIFRLYTGEGMGMRLIAQRLNQMPVPTRSGHRWSMVTIRDILRNRAYMGTYIRFGLLLPRSHPAIIPPQVFHQAQHGMRQRRPLRKRGRAEPFLLSGLLYCGYCNDRMIGATRRQTWRRKDGKRVRRLYRYYQCQSRTNHSLCQYHTWRASHLEEVILDRLREALLQRPTSQETLQSRSEPQPSATAPEGALVKRAERRFLQAMRTAARGGMSVARLGRFLSDLEAARSAAEQADAVPAKQTQEMRTIDLEAWDCLDLPRRQALLAELVARVVVRDDGVDVEVR